MAAFTAQAHNIPGGRILSFVVKELLKALPAVAFFVVGFNVIVLTTQLILYDYKGQFASFMLATTAALLVGKAVLVANALWFFRLFDTAPLIRPILFKSLVYWAVVFLARVLEQIIGYLLGGGRIAGIADYVATHFTWHRFVAIQIWILVLFLIYTTAVELNTLFGQGELVKIFFARRSSNMKLTRRQRIRTLVKLNQLTETHGVEELRDPNSAVHAAMVDLIRALATDRAGSAQQVPQGR